jgi:hypothetical protein
MRGYINHAIEIARVKEAAAKYKIDVDAGLLDSAERVAFLGIEGLTMRKLAEEKAVDMFTRIVNYAKPEWTKFHDCFVAAVKGCGIDYSEDMFNNTPIMVLHPKQPDKLIVFPSLVMDNFEGVDAPFYWARQRLLKQGATFLKTYFADKADTKRAQAWATTHRAKKRLLRNETMEVARALTRFMPELSERCTASQIRDIATTIIDYNSPVELKYADTDPTDFYTMYANGPDSCMKDNGSRQFSWMSKMDKPIHPTSIFAYSPYVKGVFMMKGSSVVARTFLYDGAFFGGAKTTGWYYGRVYGSTSKYTGIFTAALVKEGYRAMGGVGTLDMSKSYTINVPPIIVKPEDSNRLNIAAGPYMYVPYLDNHPVQAHVEYDDEAQTLVVTFNPPSSKVVNCTMSNQHGYLPASAFMNNTCHSCGGTIVAGRSLLFANDGAVFHDATCANLAGYVAAVNGSNDSRMWVHKDSDNLIVDVLTGKYYTPSGATAYRVMPIMQSFMDNPEDAEIYTSGGVIVELDGKRFRVSNAAMCTLPSRAYMERMDHNTGCSYYEINKEYLRTKYIDVKSVRTVILPEDHAPVDARTLRELERLAA